MTTTAAEATATFTDAILTRVYTATFCRTGSLRDERGNLRDFTDAEEAFRAAVKAEYTKRGLGR